MLTIEASLLAQESNLSFRVAPHQTHDDGLLFAPLEAVDTAQLDSREPLFQWGE